MPSIPVKFGGPHESARQRSNRRQGVNRGPIIVQRLVSALDDSRSLDEKAADKVFDPPLRDLLVYAVGAHWLIADDLAKHIVETGGEVVRRGSRLGALRTFRTGR